MSEELTVIQGSALSNNVFSDKDAFNQLVRVADAFSKTNLVPEAYRGKPTDCMVAIDMANRMGMPPLMVMQNLYVVKGKPSWSGQACMSLIQSSPRFTGAHTVYTGERGTDSRGCHVVAIRVPNGELVQGVEVTMAMAKAEGWINNPKWKNMPELMLAYRAASFFARVNCPDALMGVMVEGEVEDIKPQKREVPDFLAPEPQAKSDKNGHCTDNPENVTDILDGEVELL